MGISTAVVAGAVAIKVEHHRRRNNGHHLIAAMLRKNLSDMGGPHNAAALTGDALLQDSSVILFRKRIDQAEQDLLNPPGALERLMRAARLGCHIAAETFDYVLTPPELRAKFSISRN